jgi:ABC-2 type transport system permease protein
VTVWRLEVLRLFRTMRWVGLLASYLIFGIVGPLITRYQEAIFRNVGGGVTITAPSPTRGLAIAAYIGNASQIGLLVTIFVAAGSLAFDAKPEWSAFLRTRARSLADLVVPKVVVMTVAATASFALGVIAAWIGTATLIEGVPVGAMLAGIVAWALYLAFAVALVALGAGLSRSVVGAAGLTVVALLVLPVVAEVVPVLRPWSPSALVGAVVEMVDGRPALDFARATVVSLALTAAALWGSVRLLARREV